MPAPLTPLPRFNRRDKGYRYVRTMFIGPRKNVETWALWENDGERMRRVGTARTAEEYLRFICRGDEAWIAYFMDCRDKRAA